MKKLAYGIIALVVLVIVAIIALPFLIPAERLKEELMIAANDATGRTLVIAGDFGVSVFPVLGLNASKVSFSNAPSSDTANMVTIDKLTIELDLIPLLSGQISVNKFILDKPVILLEVDKAGKKNWEFETADNARKPAAKTEESSDSSNAADLGISDLNLGDVQIIDGAITYSDQLSGVSHEITAANLALDLRGLDQPFKTSGSAVWKDEKIELDTELGALRALLENKPTTIKAALTSSKVTLNYEGKITSLDPLKLGGQTDLNIPSLKDLLAWAAEPIEAKEGTFGLVSIKGDVGVSGSTYSFRNAQLIFDAIQASGDFSANLGGKIPGLKGTLTVPVLDVNPYLSEQAASNEGTAPAPATGKSKQKWDDTPIDFSGLKAVNADFKLSLGKFLVQKMTIGKTALAAKLQDAVLTLNLDELALYEGRGKGSIKVDTRSKQAKISKEFILEGLELKPFLQDAADMDRLEGTGMFQFAMTTVGTSQKTMVDNLNGKGKILFTDGAISGINLAAMARNITSAFTGGGDIQKTDFAELSASYTITNGLLKNNDLKLLNPFIQVFGKGTVNMPPKTINYRLEPKVTASSEGQGSGSKSGITVPIKISGSWDNPSFAPDLAGAIGNLADPEALKETLSKAGSGAIKKKLKNIGGGDKLQDTLKSGLGGLFGKKK